MSMQKPVVLVTGANGFVGSHLVPALEAAGWSARRAVRRAEGHANDVVVESLGAEARWREALTGVDAVIHLAARVHHKQDENALEVYRNVNIAGTLHLARSAASAGVKHFIFISTVLVHGRSNASRSPFCESDVLTPHGLYGMSKAAAEMGLKALASKTAMTISVIRPPLVYGSGAKGNFALLTRAVNRGLPLPFGAIHNHRAFLAVQNLASFIQWRLDHPDTAGNFEVFLVADNEQVSTPDFIERLARAAGKTPRLFPMSTGSLGTLLGVVGLRDTYDSLVGSLELDLGKTLSSGWRPAVSLDEGLRLALQGKT